MIRDVMCLCCCHEILASTSVSLSATTRLHLHHVLSDGERQLNDLENGLVHALERFYADGEWQEKNVEPGDEESDRPGQEPQDQEPQDRPQDARTEVSHRTVSAARSRDGR